MGQRTRRDLGRGVGLQKNCMPQHNTSTIVRLNALS